MFTKRFWADAVERAVRTFAQALVGVFTAGATVIEVDWRGALIAAGSAAAISVVMSLAGSAVGNSEDPSVLR